VRPEDVVDEDGGSDVMARFDGGPEDVVDEDGGFDS
jgi:hypothetical protein